MALIEHVIIHSSGACAAFVHLFAVLVGGIVGGQLLATEGTGAGGSQPGKDAVGVKGVSARQAGGFFLGLEIVGTDGAGRGRFVRGSG